MLLGGLWHGASWAFVVWGALHGTFLVVERLTGTGGDSDAPLRWAQLPRIVFTFHLVCLAWVFFRATSFSQAFDLLTGVATLRAGSPELSPLLLLALLGSLAIGIDLLQRRIGGHDVGARMRPAAQGALLGVAAAMVIMASGGGQVPFIYFQF